MFETVEQQNARYKAAGEALEAMVDANTLSFVLARLAEVCTEKEDHLRCNWQDSVTARAWQKAAMSIDRLATIINL